jgi:hypothetical protein
VLKEQPMMNDIFWMLMRDQRKLSHAMTQLLVRTAEVFCKGA